MQSKNKRVIYIALATVLGVLLSFLIHAGLEMTYLAWATNHAIPVQWFGGCALHPAVQIGLVIAGAFGGLLLGRWWWRIVYVERRWGRGRRKNQIGPKR